MAIPRDEQETIISYDNETKQWHYYSDVPKHNHKWDVLVKPTRRELDEYGKIAILEGEIIGNVFVNKKRVSHLTPEQRQQASERMRQAKINSKRHG
jgi:hypothetical protein